MYHLRIWKFLSYVFFLSYIILFCFLSFFKTNIFNNFEILSECSSHKKISDDGNGSNHPKYYNSYRLDSLNYNGINRPSMMNHGEGRISYDSLLPSDFEDKPLEKDLVKDKKNVKE